MLKPCADQVNALCGLVPDTEEFEPSREAMRDQTGRLLAEFEVLIERTFEARERLALLQEDQNADSAWMVIKLMITRQELKEMPCWIGSVSSWQKLPRLSIDWISAKAGKRSRWSVRCKQN